MGEGHKQVSCVDSQKPEKEKQVKRKKADERAEKSACLQ